MSSSNVASVLTFSLVLVFLARADTDEPGLPERPASASEIAELVRQLGSKKFRERDAATRALEAAGEDALVALRQAEEDSDDPEVRFRARRPVERLERRLQGIFRQASGLLAGQPPAPHG